MRAIRLVLALLGAAANAAALSAQDVCGYSVARPDASCRLVRTLTEISDVTAVDADTVACVQDEVGTLFFVNVRSGKIGTTFRFGPAGDYEGVARVGSGYFVLRSDGLLIRLTLKGQGLVVAGESAIGLPNHEFESLCYDEKHSRLLLAPKQRAATDDKDELPVYGWDLEANKLVPEPVLKLSRKQIREAAPALDPDVPQKGGKKKRERAALKIKVSALAVHPDTGDLFLLSGVDRALLVVDAAGLLKGVHVFVAEELPKPEAITFFPNGDLAIASEGVDGPAVLNVYRHQTKTPQR